MKINALASFNRFRIRESVLGFLNWWWGELRVLVPGSVESWFGNDVAHVLVQIDDHKARLVLSIEGNEQLLGDCDLATGDELSFDSLRQMVAQNVPQEARVEVELPEQRVLSSEIFLPMATEQTLDQVMRFEMDRFTPFKEDQVGYSYAIVERIPERDKIKLALNLVRRDYLVDLLASLARLGLSLSAVYRKQATPGENAASPVNRHAGGRAGDIKNARSNLLPVDLLPGTNPLWNKRNKNMLSVLLVLLGMAISLPMYLQNSRIESLEAQIAAIKLKAANAGEKQRLLVAQLEGQEILANKKNRQFTKLETIRSLTELLPDTTWVSKLVIDGSDISVQGESEKSSDLIGILEQANSFKNVAFASPVTRNSSSNMERFEIRMHLLELESARQASALEGVETTGRFN